MKRLQSTLSAAMSLVVIWTVGQIAAVAHAGEPGVAGESADRAPVFADSFEEGTEAWELFDPETWSLKRQGDNTTFEITARESAYRPPVRSPGHVAMIKDLAVGSFDLIFKVRSTKDTGGHRDCCVFFGFQDPSNFYYAHLGAVPDPASGQIMIVKDAPRRPLTKNERPTPWDEQWHQVKVERRLDDGTINVYFDDMSEPKLSVKDHTFGEGRVGIGSFDDLNEFDDIQLWSLDPHSPQP